MSRKLLVLICFLKLSIVQIKFIKTEIHCDQNEEDQYCYKIKDKTESDKNVKYLLYDVNPVEGFNLRRDVYIRVANMVKMLNKKSNNYKWILVLPPWNNLNHWKNRNLDQSKLNWSLFFDISSLNKYTPVIELNDLIKKNKNELKIDVVYYLESDFTDLNKGEFNRFKFSEKCDRNVYYKENFKIKGYFWGYSDNIYAKECKNVLFRGTNYFLADKLADSDVKFLMIERAEVMLHNDYGQTDYWNCRRSMKIKSVLVNKSNEIRSKFFHSNDIVDNIRMEENWQINKPKRDRNRGGEYLGVHVRRGDFIRHRTSVPLSHVSEQIRQTLLKLNLTKVYLSTDGTQDEINEIKNLLKEFLIVNYEPTMQELAKFKDGGIAIIDQLVCAHAKYFIGTQESTFSFRIQEEREILGFDESTTFNSFCNENELCKSAKWLIKYE